MKKKKAGFTLIEIMIVLMLTVIVIGIMTSIFSTGNRVFSDANIKSDLQIEGQSIHEIISNMGMQGLGIKEITLSDGTIDFEKTEDVSKKESVMNKWNSIQEIVLYGVETDESNKIVKKSYTFRLKNKELSMIKQGSSLGRVLSTNVENFKVNPSNMGVEVEINLIKKKGFEEKKYPIKVDVLFRNKDVIIDSYAVTI
jgi:competence protein ComGC